MYDKIHYNKKKIKKNQNKNQALEEKKKKESWSGLPIPTPGDLPDPGTEPTSLAPGGGLFTTGATLEAQTLVWGVWNSHSSFQENILHP